MSLRFTCQPTACLPTLRIASTLSENLIARRRKNSSASDLSLCSITFPSSTATAGTASYEAMARKWDCGFKATGKERWNRVHMIPEAWRGMDVGHGVIGDVRYEEVACRVTWRGIDGGARTLPKRVQGRAPVGRLIHYRSSAVVDVVKGEVDESRELLQRFQLVESGNGCCRQREDLQVVQRSEAVTKRLDRVGLKPKLSKLFELVQPAHLGDTVGAEP